MPLTFSSFTAQDIIVATQRQFGDDSGVQIKVSDVIRWINQGQLTIAQRSEAIKSSTTTASVANQGVYGFPSDKILKVLTVWYDSAVVENITFEQFQTTYQTVDSANVNYDVPTVWYEYGGAINLWPYPNADGKQIKVFFVPVPTIITINTDMLWVPDTYYETLLQYVLQQAYELDDDFNSSSIKASQHESSLARNQASLDQSSYHVITVLPEDS